MSDFFNTLFTSRCSATYWLCLALSSLCSRSNAPLAAFTVASLPPVIVLVVLFRYWSRGAYRQVRAGVSR